MKKLTSLLLALLLSVSVLTTLPQMPLVPGDAPSVQVCLTALRCVRLAFDAHKNFHEMLWTFAEQIATVTSRRGTPAADGDAGNTTTTTVKFDPARQNRNKRYARRGLRQTVTRIDDLDRHLQQNLGGTLSPWERN